jgi:Uma2 family endonuclease
MTTATRLTLDEFLAMPETEPPSEFACGRIIEKPMPTWNHAVLSSRLIAILSRYLERVSEAYVLGNLRFANRPEDRAFLPDIAVMRTEHRPADVEQRRRGALEILPDLAIEVLSPDDRPGRVADKLAFYLRAGVPLVWIIDPDDRTLAVYRPGQPSTLHTPPEVIGAAPVLSALELNLGELFAVLD